jgi:hypothetical protein
MRVAATVKELRRSLFLSRPSAVAPPELLRCRQVADWENWDLADYFSIARENEAARRRDPVRSVDASKSRPTLIYLA